MGAERPPRYVCKWRLRDRWRDRIARSRHACRCRVGTDRPAGGRTTGERAHVESGAGRRCVGRVYCRFVGPTAVAATADVVGLAGRNSPLTSDAALGVSALFSDLVFPIGFVGNDHTEAKRIGEKEEQRHQTQFAFPPFLFFSFSLFLSVIVLLISAANSSGLSAVTSQRFGIVTASVIDVLWERGRFVWSRLERRGAACGSFARRRAGPSRTEAQQLQELWCGAPESAGAMPVSISLAVLRVSSRASRASREPASSPTAPRQPHAPRFARSPRRSRRPAKNSNHRSGGSTRPGPPA